jgi:RNA polymerase sigma-70 factor (sigma-E family)
VEPAEGFEAAWHRNRHRLWRVAWLVCGDADLADDVVAAAGARAWQGWERRSVDDPGAYMRRAVVNEATDAFRRRGRDRRWTERRTGDGRARQTVDVQVIDHMTLVEALAALPVGQRAVIALRFWADLSEAATAEALGITVGTVKSRSHRALKALSVVLARPIPSSPEASDG